MCRGLTENRKKRGVIGDLWGVPTESREGKLGEAWKPRVHEPSDKDEGTQSTM